MQIIQHLAAFLKKGTFNSEKAVPERASGLKRGFGTNIIGELNNPAATVQKQNKPADPLKTITAAWKRPGGM